MTSAAELGGPPPSELLLGGSFSEASAAVAAYAGRLRAAGAPLAGVLLGVLAAAADDAARLPDDEYETLMTSVAAWVIEGYAREQGGGATVPLHLPDAAR